MSFSSHPSESVLKITMHIGSGSTFKTRMHSLQIGDTISIFKIKGKIALPDAPTTGRVVFIAGGVGMTPFRSMILHARETSMSLRITLLQVQRVEPFLYANDLKDKVEIYLPTQPEAFISTLNDLIDQQNDALFYVCGSRRFVDGAMSCFLSKGSVPSNRIYSESFGGGKRKRQCVVS